MTESMRTVTTVSELEALPVEAVVRGVGEHGWVWEKDDVGWRHETVGLGSASMALNGPFLVLYVPTSGARTCEAPHLPDDFPVQTLGGCRPASDLAPETRSALAAALEAAQRDFESP